MFKNILKSNPIKNSNTLNLRLKNYVSIFTIIVCISCSSINRSSQDQTTPSQSPAPSLAHESTSLNEPTMHAPSFETLENRIFLLENKLSHLQETLNAKNSSEKSSLLINTPIQKNIDPSIVNSRGERFHLGSQNSSHINKFTEAKILFDSKQWSEAQLRFSQFLQENSDHPLSAAAQFYISLSYYFLKNWSVSKENFEKILTQYPYSSHITDALQYLVEIEMNLNNPKQSQIYEQTLLSLFPQSPQAHSILDKKTKDKSSMSTPKSEQT
jgi:TolA-binding protein